VIFDLGHTLMHLDSSWSEIFERGASDLAAFLAKRTLDMGPGVGSELDGKTFAETLLEYRKEAFAQAEKTMREVTAEASMRATFERFGFPDPEPALVRDAVDAFFSYERSRWLADPEAVEVLQVLADRGLRLALFSNATDDRFIQDLVDHLGFRPWLDPVLSSAGTGIRKPDPNAFAPILEAWGLSQPLGTRGVVVVGDTLEADILGAQRAGMGSVWIPARNDARQEGPDASRFEEGTTIAPDVTLRRLGELPGRLDEAY
jgi:HAD superfamily hydrolase (TIGR01549 family)